MISVFVHVVGYLIQSCLNVLLRRLDVVDQIINVSDEEVAQSLLLKHFPLFFPLRQAVGHVVRVVRFDQDQSRPVKGPTKTELGWAYKGRGQINYCITYMLHNL